MHAAFRTIGQQMGMQLIRGILPESIDVFINDIIIEKTQQELLNGVHTAIQDNVNLQASTMNPINTFRNLYRTVRYELYPLAQASDNKVDFYNELNGFYVINIPTINNSEIELDKGEYRINPMMFLGFSVEYENTLRGNAVACRLIGADTIETTLRDYCNGASKDSPIVVLNSKPIIKDSVETSENVSTEQLEIYTGTKNASVKYLNIKYIKVPNVVKYDIDLSKCINCDLAPYTHYEIVERAVNKYFISIDSNVTNKPNQVRQQ